ncbi:Coiled-coil domain-containing protein 62 [Desmophyllum pertusum]|uniref:Coiled-coil domain-containing protein 62 n=1 Tax=Desmophyllum pertusum TaxID=174260 RepID=A0A9W9ZUP1_9CNID|nr:Coiled-coil domain-containing protein 62 [Desmophyllum pertusum]
MERFGGSLPVKGYSGEMAGKSEFNLQQTSEKVIALTIPVIYFTAPPKQSFIFFNNIAKLQTKTSNTSYQTGVSPSRAQRSKSPLRSTSPVRRPVSPSIHRATSPRLHNSSFSPTNKQLSDVDSDTIQRQRRELQLLIGELKDRDRLKVSEKVEKNKGKALEDTQLQLQQVSEHANTSLHQVQELEEKNSALTSSMRELSNTIGHLQAREQELLTKHKLKDNDIMEANVSLGELQQKIKRLEGLCQELRKTESSLRTERDQWRDQATANKHEVEKLRGDISKQFSDADDVQAELAKTKQETLVLQKELFLAGEREKRKDQLLDLQKSKQERTDSELQNLRQICERQQRDISYMQLQLQSSHDMLSKHVIEPDKMSELESNPPDEEKKAINSFYDATSYNLNGDYFDNQDEASTRSMDFDGPVVSKGIEDDLSAYIPGGGGVSSLSMHATAGSDLADDFDNLSHDPLQTVMTSDRGFASSNVETFLPPRNPSYFSTPNTRTDMYPPLGNLSITSSRQDDHTGVSVARTSPPKAEGDSSPTSKLHRLLAESRQMVQNLEQSNTFSLTGSPKQDSTGPTSEQYTPPQRHLGSPLHSRPMQTSAE